MLVAVTPGAVEPPPPLEPPLPPLLLLLEPQAASTSAVAIDEREPAHPLERGMWHPSTSSSLMTGAAGADAECPGTDERRARPVRAFRNVVPRASQILSFQVLATQGETRGTDRRSGGGARATNMALSTHGKTGTAGERVGRTT